MTVDALHTELEGVVRELLKDRADLLDEGWQLAVIAEKAGQLPERRRYSILRQLHDAALALQGWERRRGRLDRRRRAGEALAHYRERLGTR